MKNIVETTDLTKIYGHTTCVDHLDLRVPEKCVYGFLGPNGAGKSTTMKMLLHLVKPTSGEIKLFGAVSSDANRMQILRKTGSLIEAPSYYGHLSGRENLEIVQQLKQAPKEEIDEVLSIVRMDKQQNKKVDHYSLGMKQRLGIAMALLGNPKLLLLDEPTNGLDPAGIQEIRELIRSLPSRYGMTVIISSHLLSEIDQMADQVGIIDKGQLIFQDSMSALQAHSKKNLLLHTRQDQDTLSLLQKYQIPVKKVDKGLLLPDLTEEQTSQLIADLVHDHVGILRIEEQHKSLEDIFLGLTGRRMSL